MSNRITEKYFTQDDFSQRAPAALAESCRETGFVSEIEIFRGYIYDRQKVGSLIYRGTWKDRPAVLKLQGLKPETDEADMVQGFAAQNRSKLVRVPEVYAHQPWSEELGYGYLLSESIEGPPIFEMPNAKPEEIADFCRFFQEYRTNCVREPWIPAPEASALDFTLARVANWRRICEHKGRLTQDDFAARYDLFVELAKRHLADEHLVFCHGHLTANDILKPADGTYVLLSNLFWGWRLQWHDLGFNLWALNLRLNPENRTFDDMTRLDATWRSAYRAIPAVQADPDFNRRFDFVMLERTLGAILADLGAGDAFDPETGTQKGSFAQLLKLHQDLFDQLAFELA